ncbi:hypothetical protein O181_069282 [Austropuccinia psidii MF-1]|uniref:Uncharacterized protein n=1 Tax=Austropuccinia psidii MF-1 TaxID=1389203 RepID=A0A9Q3F108_9BASI|nr:hypothetical protein [Austropuccinia psidii MF-1]
MENSFEEAIFNIKRDRPMSWFLKQKDRLTALHPDMSETMTHKRILRKCGGDLEHAIKSRCIEPCCTADYSNAMEDITTRKKIGRNWYKPPMDNKTSGKPITKPNKPHDKAPFKCHKCGNKAEDTKETNNLSLHNSNSEPSEEEEVPYELSIENINFSFEVTEVHTHLPQYSSLPKVCKHRQGSCTLVAAAHVSSHGRLSFVRGRAPSPDFNFFFIFVLFLILTMTTITTPAPSHNIKDGKHSPVLANYDLTCYKTSDAEENN